jgi:hypothetical protein
MEEKWDSTELKENLSRNLFQNMHWKYLDTITIDFLLNLLRKRRQRKKWTSSKDT